ncbi:hypothetical protein CLBKND_00797 [Methylorubrum aminovorans]
MGTSSLVVAAALAAIPVAPEAKVSTSVARAPTLTTERYLVHPRDGTGADDRDGQAMVHYRF